MQTFNNFKILVIGAGSIGNRHIKNLNTLGYDNIDIIEPYEEARLTIEGEHNVNRIYRTIKELEVVDYDMGFICTPPALHLKQAIFLAENGVDLFIEKPLSHDLNGLNQLVGIINKKDLIVMVGYNQRFNPGIVYIKENIGKIGKVLYIRAEVGQYLPDWRKGSDYRLNYSARKDLGGGIMLDASHEIDYVLDIMQKEIAEVKGFSGKLSSLEIDVDDMAELLIRFKGGELASIHLDMVEKGYNRSVKVLGSKGSIRYDFSKKKVTVWGLMGENSEAEFRDFDMNDTYLEELRHFIACHINREVPAVTLDDGIKVLEIIERIRAAG